MTVWVLPNLAPPSKWEQDYSNDKNHGTNNSSVKLSMNFVLIGCHRPTNKEGMELPGTMGHLFFQRPSR